MSQTPQIVRRGEGRTFKLGHRPTVNVYSAWVGGGYLMFEHDVPPRGLGMPHSHENEDQVAYVLEGTIGFYVGGQEFVATVGDTVLRPRGLPHSLWNPTDEPARMLEITNPGRFEEYFDGLEQLFVTAQPADEIHGYQAQWGVSNFPEVGAELEKRHSVHLLS